MIVDSDGPGGKPYTVFESGAILMYLAEKTGKFMPKDMAKKYDVIQWLMVQMSGVGPAFGNFTHYNLFAPKPADAYSLTRYKTEMLRLYDLLNDRLTQAKYLGGDEYSSRRHGDLPWTRQHAAHGVKIDEKQGLKRWFEELSARPAIKAMIAKQNDIKIEPRDPRPTITRTGSSTAGSTRGRNLPYPSPEGGGWTRAISAFTRVFDALWRAAGRGI